MTLTERLSHMQAVQGAQVEVMYLVRSDTPSPEELRTRFNHAVKLQRVEPHGNRVVDLATMWTNLRRIYRDNAVDVVHCHSTVAGVIGRGARMGIRSKVKVFYSPHGFAFLRLNMHPIVRRAVLGLERFLARRGSGLILSSNSEMALAAETIRAPRAFLLRNGLSHEAHRIEAIPEDAKGRLTVGMVGRVCYQKAPWRFAAVAKELSSRADFVWVGGGDEADIDRWLGRPEVDVTGWINADELKKTISGFDLLLFPTLWEGMALSLIQAQLQGVPAIVSDVVGNVDCVVDGRTGYICRDDDELVARTAELLDDHELRLSMATNARTWARANLTDDHIGVGSLEIYDMA
ncbi:glycosyltransferase [Microterricola viridarii]|nr:glycosyltransferase [Microterricola viridarii]